jgi:hypothetical protein
MKYIYLLGLFLLANTVMKAQEPDQEFNEFMKNIQQDFDTSLNETSHDVTFFIDSLNIDYLRFLQDAEKEFIELLKLSFSDHKLIKPDSMAEEPKPFAIPVNESPTPELYKIPIKETFIPNPYLQDQLIIMPSLTREKDTATGNVNINFLGYNLTFLVDSGIILLKGLTEITPARIGDYYAALETTGCTDLIKQLIITKTRLNLNDWGYFLLVDRLSESMCNDANTQKLVSWYLLLKASYKVKIGIAENKLYILFAPRQNVYEMAYLVINRDKYYAWECDLTNITTYDCEYFNARKYLDLYQNQPILFAEERVEKPVNFQYHEKTYSFKLCYDKQYIDYFSGYPKLDLHYYFSTPVSAAFKESVNTSLRPFIKNKNQLEALNFLLALVQYSFQYKTDIEQFGHEKYMLPEELLFYGHSDCDDRTALFVYLVNELLNLNILALDFEGHVCTAVEITDQSASGSVLYNNRSYTVCDPTYIGAPAGFLMPPYRVEDALAIDFNMYQNDYRLSSTIWNKLNEGGGFEADNSSNVVCDTNRNIYATGIFRGSLVAGEQHYEVQDSNFHAFLVKMNNRYETEWTKTFDGTGNNYAYCLANSARNNLFIFGYFEKSITIDGKKLLSENKGDFFVSKFSDKGSLLWIEKIPLTKPIIESAGFSAIIDSAGNLLYMDALDKNYADNNQIGIDTNENCYLIGMTPLLVYTSDSNKIYADGNEFDLISYLVNENDRLINQNYPKTISLFYSLINFIKKAETTVLSGTILQRTLKSVNHEFQSDSPVVYDNIGKINKIDNMDGLISLKTIDQQPVFFNPLKAEDNAVVKLGYQYDNARLDVLNGITIGNNDHWFKLNYILFDKTSGEIIYNYDNHYQKKLPVQSELIR